MFSNYSFILYLLCPVWNFGHHVIEYEVFSKEHVCDINTLKDEGCIISVSEPQTVNYLTRCAEHCLGNSSCDGFLWTAGELCSLLALCTSNIPECSEGNSMRTMYYRKEVNTERCLNGGLWNSNKQKCDCSGGRVGSRCERYASSCYELAKEGYPKLTRAKFIIQPPGFNSSLRVMCSLWHGNAKEIKTFVSIRTSNAADTFSFNRNWDDYVSGFNSFDAGDTNDHWVGLELLHYLTVSQNVNKITISIFLKDDFIKYSYKDFKVMGKTQNYAAYGLLDRFRKGGSSISVSEGNINVTDTDGCFVKDKLSLTTFSTPDHDNAGLNHPSCRYEAGWWFTNCTASPVCNPLGQFYTSANEASEAHHIHIPYYDIHKVYDQIERIRISLLESSPTSTKHDD